MNSKLYVGNLSFSSNQNEIEQLFSGYGKVKSVSLIMDRETGRSKGFAFVEMSSPSEAEECITHLNGKDTAGRALRVSFAESKAPSNNSFNRR